MKIHFCKYCPEEWLKIVLCFFGKHNWYKVRPLSDRTDLVGCSFCNRFWGMNHDTETLLVFDKELYEFYKSFGVSEMKGTNFELKEFITKDRPLSMLRG